MKSSSFGSVDLQWFSDPAPTPMDPPAQPPDPPPAPEYAQPWMQQLPREMWKNESLARHGKLADLSKAYLDLESRVSSLPQVPEKPEDYGLTFAEEGEQWDFARQYAADFAVQAKEAGLPKEAAGKIFAWEVQKMMDSLKARQEAAAAEKSEAEAALKADWGAEYTAKAEQARRAVTALLSEEEVRMVDARGIGNAPWFLRLMQKVGAAMGEDNTLPSNTPGNPGSGRPGLLEYPNSPELYESR